MRYGAAEKLEIIRLVEQSSLSVRRTLAQLGIPRSTFYAWYERYLARGAGALEDGQPAPRRVWNKLPDTIAEAVLELALKEPALSPRELAVSFVDRQRYFVSESSVYRLLKAHDLITSPAFILMKAADSFAHPTRAPNQLWQTDFTYLRVIGWGWFYLSTVLDDFSRYILAWKLCTTMTATDVSDTLTMALRSRCACPACARPIGVRHVEMLMVGRDREAALQPAGKHSQRPQRVAVDQAYAVDRDIADRILDEHQMRTHRGQRHHFDPGAATSSGALKL